MHGWFSALGYAKLHNLPTDTGALSVLGRKAARIARDLGVEAAKTQHAHFGRVNLLPEHIWDDAVTR